MKIDHLTLQNFRKYTQAQFQFHPRMTVLIGENGSGKTTILDALAIMLNSWFIGSGIRTGCRAISKEDIHTRLVEKGDQLFNEPRPETTQLTTQATLPETGQTISWQRDAGDRGRKARTLQQQGTGQRQMIAEGGTPELPLLLYYGAGRLWDIHQHVETEGPGSQLDAYRFCLDPKSDHKAFEKWFKKLTQSALQRGRQSGALQTVQQAVLHCIPGASEFYYDIEQDQPVIHIDTLGWQTFNNLSDGYRNMVAMVADIAHRASRLNPHHNEQAARQTTGVVLIDEIDLHLHPRWQRLVVQSLQQAFPRLQFIATTHSPFILQSLEPGQVIDLNHSEPFELAQLPPDIAAPGPANTFSHRSVEDITEQVMGVELPQRSDRHQQMYHTAQQYYRLLQQAEGASADQLQQLSQELDRLSAPFSDDIAYHAFLEMERTAAGLGNRRDNQDEADA